MRFKRFIAVTMLCCSFLASGCNRSMNGASPTATPVASMGGLKPGEETLPAPTGTQQAEKENCANENYPVITGASWKYTGSNSIGNSFSFIRTITNASDAGFEDQDVWDSGTIRTGSWTCDNGDLTALSQGGVATVSVPAGPDTPELEAESVEADGVSIPGEMKINESWDQSINLVGKMTLLQGGMTVAVTNETQITCTPASVENVSVPAGSFEAIKVVCTSSMAVTIDNNAVTTVTSTSTIWYVSGVGIAKIVDDNEMGQTTIELAEYNIPMLQP
jgi:hypothetical protein